MIKVLAVAMGGAMGALARFGVGELMLNYVGGRTFIGTMIVNILGCFLFGALHATTEFTGWGSAEVRALIFTGFLGAFTTFSTFEAETFGIWTTGFKGGAILYMFGSVALGMLAFLLGWGIVSRVVA